MLPPTPVLLDADPGIDDALAIAYLVAEHRAGRIDLVGLVCTAGNVGLADTVRNALAWLDLAGAPPLAVAAGAAGALVTPHVFTPETHGPTGSGYATLKSKSKSKSKNTTTTTPRALDPRGGARLWVDVARAHPGELVGVVTGPSSTLARALELEPTLPTLLRRLVVMGGSFRGHPGNTTPVAEWNVHVDPEAADRVCTAWEQARGADSRVEPALWCGLDLTEQALWTPGRSADLLAASDTPLTRALVEALRFYFEFHESVGEGYLAQVHDPFVAWAALHPEEVTSDPVNLRVECAGEHTRGMTVADPRGQRGRVVNARIASGVTVPGGAPEVLDVVCASIAGPGRSGEVPSPTGADCGN